MLTPHHEAHGLVVDSIRIYTTKAVCISLVSLIDTVNNFFGVRMLRQPGN